MPPSHQKEHRSPSEVQISQLQESLDVFLISGLRTIQFLLLEKGIHQQTTLRKKKSAKYHHHFY